jgi:hypothetical protein
MAAYSSQGKPYQQPAVPAEHNGLNGKAFLRGWHRGIWHDTPAGPYYKSRSLQAAFEAGHAEARRVRLANGDTGIQAGTQAETD